MVLKRTVLMLFLVCLVRSQVTPEDLEKMKLKLQELENELFQLVPEIDSDINQIESDMLEVVRQKGDERAVRCAQEAADILSLVVHQIGYFNLIGLAGYLQQCRQELDLGILTQDELEQIKRDLLQKNGFFRTMTDLQIQQTKSFDVKKIFEFTQAADRCCKQ